jgi:hypothetical protein
MNMKCIECEEVECYECWLIGESKEAIDYRRYVVNKEFERVFG